MQLEFHQLDRRWEHLRVHHPARQRRLLASLAESGQQVPIVVVAADGPADRYVVIDGYKRIAALEQLGRDTVEAVVWPMSEAAAVLLDRSLRLSEHETALEVGWLLAELEQRFGYSVDELARRFDRSVSWVSRRLALVEVLPEAIQQQVREGKIPAQVALKFLVPVARQSLEDCQRMAAIFAQRHCDTREAGQLYAAWSKGSPAVRKRILDDPELFFKTQRQAQEKTPAGTGAELLRDLEMVVAIVNRAQRRLADRSTRQLLKRLARLDVLLIDEFGYLTLKPEQGNIFFKLMEERYHCHSTIITTNLVYDEWHNFLGNKSMVDALLSRVRRLPPRLPPTSTPSAWMMTV